jgi:L-tyrosine isonitrile synthase
VIDQSSIDLQAQIDSFCIWLNQSGYLRAATSSRSDVGLRLRDLMVTESPLNFVLYWGVWKRPQLNRSAIRLISRLEEFRSQAVATLGIPTQVQIVFTDTHAAINGVDQETIAKGRVELTKAVPQSFQVCSMSSLVQPSNFIVTWEPDSNSKQRRVADLLVDQANKLFGEDAAAERASKYYVANIKEAPSVAVRWPLGIFLHYGLPELKVMLPSLPILYCLAGAKGSSKKPWFD